MICSPSQLLSFVPGVTSIDRVVKQLQIRAPWITKLSVESYDFSCMRRYTLHTESKSDSFTISIEEMSPMIESSDDVIKRLQDLAESLAPRPPRRGSAGGWKNRRPTMDAKVSAMMLFKNHARTP